MWGCKDTNFLISLYINICRNIDMYFTYTPKAKKRGGRKDKPGAVAMLEGPSFRPRDWRWRHVPPVDSPR
jgi:hypothetical protein